jgi:hypothetical protein
MRERKNTMDNIIIEINPEILSYHKYIDKTLCATNIIQHNVICIEISF